MTLGRVKLHTQSLAQASKAFRIQICLELNLVVDGLYHPVQQAIVGKETTSSGRPYRAPWMAGR